MTTQNIAATGTTGFVGKNILPYLAEHSVNVYAVVRDGAAVNERSVQVRHFDPGYIDNNNISAILHIAGKAHDLKNVSDPGEYFQVNTELTKKIFASFIASKATLFIYLSSVKAVTDSADEMITESFVADPQTVYGQSKLAAEKYLLSYTLPVGKRCVILRSCMIHGPGNKGNLNLLYKFIDAGIPYPLGAFENRRSFLSVGNLCYVINSILKDPSLETGVYNIADDEPLSTNELINEIAKASGKRPLIMKWNISFVKWIARLGDKIHFPFNSDRLGKLTENFVVSNKKLVGALKIKLPVSAIEGIRKTIQSFVVHK